MTALDVVLRYGTLQRDPLVEMTLWGIFGNYITYITIPIHCNAIVETPPTPVSVLCLSVSSEQPSSLSCLYIALAANMVAQDQPTEVEFCTLGMFIIGMVYLVP